MSEKGDRVAKHGFTSLDDVDPNPKSAYRDRDGRGYVAPGFLARFDPAAAVTKGDSPDLDPSLGKALLDLFVCTDERAEGTGVVLLDGRAVAAGDGRYQAEVEPGRHRLEVQGYDATTTEFEAVAGERVCFTTGQGAAVRHHIEFRTELRRVTGRDGFMPVMSAKAANASGIGCLMSIAALPVIVGAGIAMAFVSGTIAEVALSVVLLLGLAALVAGFTMGVKTTGRLHKRAKATRLESHRVATGGAIAFPGPVDAQEWVKERGARGVLLVSDLFLYRLTRTSDGAEYTGSGEHLAFAHAAGPRVWIDGIEAPADWASWHYPLTPGEHRFAVEYGDSEARHEFTVKVKDVPDLTVVHVPVQVFKLWDADTAAPAELPPRITHSVQREAKSTLAKLNRNESANDVWVPTRYWTARPPQA
ncbi:MULTISPECIES: hypothetical protein [Glycomyces]|uniref:Uncharacterized protein n=2 Tax=Glycomyces TaxID=58113 RepID=A0A9X3PEZ8_9ACTN|nr:hypothetical protein [Glycomyces lechevalierae]MDA1384246.1 hypothetical protein [Glycomyces lechevalierae]MDR7339324.1 hypothetical protein [Glycomyces lechevalierae]